MNLQKMIDAQRELDNHIVSEKGLENADTVPDLYVALQVEIGEFANEGRWFKFWSDNQEPNSAISECETCGNLYVGELKSCEVCFEEHSSREDVLVHNPLLEEFVDGVHLFLSIAIKRGWEESLYNYGEQLDPDEWSGNITSYYLEMTYFLNASYIRKYTADQEGFIKDMYGITANQFDFRMAWICFLNIGINGFGLKSKGVERAYFEKNKINHERQVNGY